MLLAAWANARSRAAAPLAVQHRAFHAAVVGAGPAGLYTAKYLRANGFGVDVYERWPSPHGLVRCGVAPDHQATKHCALDFEELLRQDEHCKLLANVTVGSDVDPGELVDAYDAVVVATGAEEDTLLFGLERAAATASGIIPSGPFSRWYNGHFIDDPAVKDVDDAMRRWAADKPRKKVVVVGFGNVAIDVGRVVAKLTARPQGRKEILDTDVRRTTAETISGDPLHVRIIGRKKMLQANFSNSMVRELLNDPTVVTRVLRSGGPVDPATLSSRMLKRAHAMHEQLEKAEPVEGKPLIDFCDELTPVEPVLDSQGWVTALRCRTAQGVDVDLECDLVVTATGYKPGGIGQELKNAGHAHVFSAGWARKGADGTIAVTLLTSRAVADEIKKTIVDEKDISKRNALVARLSAKASGIEEWMRVDAHERAAGEAKQCIRVKGEISADEMLAIGRTT